MKSSAATISIICICLCAILAADAFAIQRPDRGRHVALLAAPMADSTMVLDSVVYVNWVVGVREDTLKLIHRYTASGYVASTTIQQSVGGQWVDSLRYWFTYDDQGRVIERTEQEWNGSIWTYGMKRLFHYDGAGRLEDSVTQYRNAGPWEDFTQWLYTYDGSGNQIEMLYQINQWIDTGLQWVNDARHLSAYDGSGNRTELVEQYWPYPSGPWTNNTLDSMFYDGHDNNTQRIEYVWDVGAWEPAMKYTFYYDARSNMTEELWQYEDMGSWENTWYFQYTYDAHDNWITYWEQHWSGYKWDNVWRDSSSYDGLNRITENIGEYWLTGNWVTSTRGTYTYDVHGHLVQLLWESRDDTVWVNDAATNSYYSVMTSAPTDVGSDVQVEVDSDITVTFDSITTAGHTAAQVSGEGPIASAFVIMPVGAPEYVYITTDASFMDSVEICLDWAQGALTRDEEDSLVLLHYHNADWEDITTSKDTVGNRICGRTDDLSPFALAVPGVSVGVAGENTTLPAEFALKPNYPNPFNPTTVIAFELPRSSAVEIRIFNILGQAVRTLTTGKRAAGRHQVTWDGRDNAGRTVSSGTYFYRIEAGEFSTARKMLLLK